ncbi:MAG: MarR family transcriptional regulator, partial [Nitrososphaerales archaeon]
MWAVHALGEDARSSSDLVRSLHVSKQAVSVLVEELVRSGYTKRSTDPGDRRRAVLVLTPRGR